MSFLVAQVRNLTVIPDTPLSHLIPICLQIFLPDGAKASPLSPPLRARPPGSLRSLLPGLLASTLVLTDKGIPFNVTGPVTPLLRPSKVLLDLVTLCPGTTPASCGSCNTPGRLSAQGLL